MTRRMLSIATVVSVGIVALAALTPQGDQNRPAVTLSGCLRVGSSSTVYLLRGAGDTGTTAAAAPDRGPASMIPEDYLLVSIAEGLDLTPHVNHRIAVTGVVSEAKDPPPPPPGANTAERALKKLSVQSVKEIASNCAVE